MKTLESILIGIADAFYQIGKAILLVVVLIWVWTPDWVKWCIGKISQFISWYANGKVSKTKFALNEFRPEDFFLAFQKDYASKFLVGFIKRQVVLPENSLQAPAGFQYPASFIEHSDQELGALISQKKQSLLKRKSLQGKKRFKN
mgnify:CR=1 FL=1